MPTYSSSRPIKLTVEDARGVTVYAEAYYDSMDTGYYNYPRVAFRLHGEATYTPSEPPVGSVVLLEDGRSFQHTSKTSWRCYDESCLTWPSIQDKVKEVVHWKESK